MLHTQFSRMLATRGTEGKPTGDHLAGPQLVVRSGPSATAQEPARLASSVPELFAIASRRCSAFFAEASVLVLVFGILDFVIQRGHIESAWVAGALLISIALLAASIATEFSARRWLGAQP